KLKNTRSFALCMLILSASFTACKKDSEDDFIEEPKEVEILQGEITTKKVLDADKVYLLRGYVRVMGDGGHLEIPAGTVIEGEKASMGALIVERGGYIKANGSPSNPIICTS